MLIGLLLDLIFQGIGDIRVILVTRDVAALPAQTSQFAGAGTEHDKPGDARGVVCICPARLKHKATAAPAQAPDDMV